ncbi:MAG: hypothetical protein ACFCAD_12950 [Pleurocapsa sp.]
MKLWKQALSTGGKLGLWRLSQDKKRAVATPTAVRLLQSLPNLQETCAAILSCEPDIRRAWGKIIAARLKDLGNLKDVSGLIQTIGTLEQASKTILQQISDSVITSTEFTELETIIFGTPAEQAPVTPKLLRVLGATASLVEEKQDKSKPLLANVDPFNPAVNWVKGRILQMPSRPLTTLRERKELGSIILSGDHSPSEQETMNWVLSRPWIFLLAQIVFIQEAWSAERIAGKLSLELPEAQIDRFHQPEKILVIITLPTGEEITCGTLGELIIRVLNYLEISLLAPIPPTDAEYVTSLNASLSNAIAILLQKQIWQFNPGGSGRNSSYSIHPDFSDSCYGVLGAKYFNRLGDFVSIAIRNSCEAWVEERSTIKESLPVN